jgi:hypothetical protein
MRRRLAWNTTRLFLIKSAYSELVVGGAIKTLSYDEEAEFERELEDLYAENELAV